MAASDRTTAADLGGHLEREAARFSAFQAIELIQGHYDGGRETGTHALAADEKLFFGVDHSLAFPLSDVADIRRLPPTNDGGVERFRINVTFLGLHGSGTPLPSYFAEEIARFDADESVTKGFNDFFHNRLVGLLFRAWRKHRYYRRYQPGGRDPFSSWVFSLFGLGSAESRASTHIYWPRLLCFAGMLSTRNRSPSMMARIIVHAFRLSAVDIDEWVQRKVRISADQTTRLGRGNSSLGHNMILGNGARDIQGKIRIVIRNLTFQRFQDFLPHGADYKRLRGLVEFMMRDQLAYDLKLGLLPSEAHPLTMKRDCPGRLGWSSFLGDRKYAEARDVIIRVRS
ncbi:type VI secretion system baseplate subunit TssG [Neorhizobium sp. T786]|uniref:type VI secretion system baseplate subunit TssG n=1 Tax=Pseudorhizobium xiangyangii TaxID=2883104 RepID=UPI001CFF64D3|nr:type VI secretion system baseplate subunit TssG [Neorhizobium xiangyangii]MCB5205265.1 type VI secretion system baseplate subunit TssG [Neorhizobium xiangyangii]